MKNNSNSDEIKTYVKKKTVRYTLTDYKINKETAKELNITNRGMQKKLGTTCRQNAT